MKTQNLSKEELRVVFDRHEDRRRAAIDDYAKVLKIEPKKPLQIYLALRWLRQGYENRTMFLKNQCDLSSEEVSAEIHILSTNVVKELGAVAKTIQVGEFDSGGV